jgi:hypothetical protein
MARLTIGQKAERVLKFPLALRNPRIAAMLAQYNFTQADPDEGWDLLRNITRTRLDVLPEDAPIDPGALRAPDEWENKSTTTTTTRRATRPSSRPNQRRKSARAKLGQGALSWYRASGRQDVSAEPAERRCN